MVEQKKHVVYVPYWIAGALQRNNLPLSTLLDYRKVAKFFSPQEQANMLLFEEINPFKAELKDGRLQPVYGVTEVGSTTSITESCFDAPLYDAWRQCVSNSTDANDNALVNNLSTMNSLSWNETTKAEVSARFDPANAGRLNYTGPFITYDVERNYLLVVIYPAFFESAVHEANVVALCKQVLETFYVYNTPASGCKTPYFRKYLESLG
jgi:hypothetical protein